MVHEVVRVVLAAQGLVVKRVDAAEVRIVVAELLAAVAVPCLSHITSQN
jgi:uncharacterized membrane protein YjjB (DUF3815 family)